MYSVAYARVEPRSLLSTCIKVLKNNHKYINMTILPVEVAEKLNKYINATPTFNMFNFDRLQYTDCIITTRLVLCDACAKFIPIQINPNRPHIQTYSTYLSMHLFDYLSVSNKFLMDKFGNYFPNAVMVYAIKLSNINTTILKYLFENKLCIYVHDMPHIV